MCVSMLEPCVLVGLEWVESMMKFLLHFTCSYIVHAYVPLHFLFWYFLLIGAFLFVSLSLSFSPFLSDGLRMVSKHKTTPSQNPFRFEASSSDSTPLYVRDEKAYQDFSKNFSERSIHSKCHIILSDFSNTTLPTVIYKRG